MFFNNEHGSIGGRIASIFLITLPVSDWKCRIIF